MIVRLRQWIRLLTARQRGVRTSTRKGSATPIRPRRNKRQRTGSRSTTQNPDKSEIVVPNEAERQTVVPIEIEEQTTVPFEKEQQWAGVRVKIETDNKVVQTEAPSSGVIRVMNSKQRNKKVQVQLPTSIDAWKKDPKTRTLHHQWQGL